MGHICNISLHLLDPFAHTTTPVGSEISSAAGKGRQATKSPSLLISSPKELYFTAFELSSHDTYAISLNFVLRQFSLSSFQPPLPMSPDGEPG